MNGDSMTARQPATANPTRHCQSTELIKLMLKDSYMVKTPDLKNAFGSSLSLQEILYMHKLGGTVR
jgi:hypothetical protein